MSPHRDPDNSRIAAIRYEFDELISAAVSLSKAEEMILQLAEDWNIFNKLLDALDIGGVLTDHVPLNQRYLLDRWLSAIRKIDESIEQLDDVSMDAEEWADPDRPEGVK